MNLRIIIKCIPIILLSNFSFAYNSIIHISEVQHYYDMADVKYHDKLYAFQLDIAKNCLEYHGEKEEKCKNYLKEQRRIIIDEIDGYDYSKREVINFLNVKLAMIQDTLISVDNINHGNKIYHSKIVEDSEIIMENYFRPEIKSILRDELRNNNGKTGLNYPGSNKILINRYAEEINRYGPEYMEEINKKKDKDKEVVHLKEMLFSKEYLRYKTIKTNSERTLESLLSDFLGDMIVCNGKCATNVVIRINGTELREISLVNFLFFGLKDYRRDSVDVLYPEEYFNISNGQKYAVVDVLQYVQSYIRANRETLLIDRNLLLKNQKPSDIESDSWEVMKKSLDSSAVASVIWKKAAVPNIRRLYNSIIKITTEMTGSSIIDSASYAMNKSVTSSFKLAHIGKTFNIAGGITAVVTKLPRFIRGEWERSLCKGDELGDPIHRITLEEQCVFVPSFKIKSFPITVSSLLQNTDGESYNQDVAGYNIYIVHDSGLLIAREKITKKQEYTIYKDSFTLLDKDVSHYSVKIVSNFTNSVVAQFRLNNRMFRSENGGVIKGNKFHFVKKIENNESKESINGTRAFEVCQRVPVYGDRQAYFHRCLNEKFYEIHPYYLQNMKEVLYETMTD